MLDHPVITSAIFFPRRTHPGGSRLPNAADGTVTVEGDIQIGYRYYPHEGSRDLLLYFHGNGEVAADHDSIARLYHQRVGVNFMVVDFRGYGWSTGEPKTTAMLPDAEAVFKALPDIVGPMDRIFVMGRSLGGPSAMHLAATFPDQIDGLIVESTLSSVISWLMRKGFGVNMLPNAAPDLDFANRLADLHMPLLVIHGAEDQLIPPSEGRRLYEASPAEHKRLLLIEGAGHNTLLSVGLDDYLNAVRTFIQGEDSE